MNRLTLEEVREAYQKSGLIPYQGALYIYDWTDALPTGGCALGALQMCRLDKSTANGWSEVSEVLGLSSAYTQGFIIGFDGSTVELALSWFDKQSDAIIEEVRQGWEDGAAIWKGLQVEETNTGDGTGSVQDSTGKPDEIRLQD